VKEKGLGQAKWAEIGYICDAVSGMRSYTREQFDRLVKDYESSDKELFQILETAQLDAHEHYTTFLNARIAKVNPRFPHLSGDFSMMNETATTIGRFFAEVRSGLSNEGEFRKKFLAPAIRETAYSYDQDLQASQKMQERGMTSATRGSKFGIGL
jgi:hypothetical protein